MCEDEGCAGYIAGKRLPDVRTCRIRCTGTTGQPDCAAPDSADCIYAQSYRFGFFCGNPLWRELRRETDGETHGKPEGMKKLNPASARAETQSIERKRKE